MYLYRVDCKRKKEREWVSIQVIAMNNADANNIAMLRPLVTDTRISGIAKIEIGIVTFTRV